MAKIDQQQSFGLRVWSGRPHHMPAAHLHSDLEVNLLERGEMHYVLAGRSRTVPTGQLVVFWGAVPHRVTSMAAGTFGWWMTIPLGWFLQTQPPGNLTDALLTGQLVGATALSVGDVHIDVDLQAMRRWRSDLKHGGGERRRIVLLEIEARLRRLAIEQPGPTARRGRLPKAERMAAYLTRHYTEPVRMADVANSVGLHPNYAMDLFRKALGQSMGHYLTALRLSHAQRLLITTDRTVLDIAMDAGFGSASRFYEAFAASCQCSPGQYRTRMRQAQT